MDKLDMESKNIIRSNIELLGELFPNIITVENENKKINFDILKQELSDEIIDDKKEKYQLTWPGKKEAILNANTPTRNVLIPDKDKSENFETTENIYIEGDNLETLKILQESYLNKIKCIFIDPPYNTGNDFIYNDNFSHSNVDELINSGRLNEDGNIVVSKDINSLNNGRFHSDWLSMMYPRLKLSRNLLSEDGVIFISIDENEQVNLQKLCEEIFGESNFIGNFIWVNRTTPNDPQLNFASSHEYILVFAKNKNKIKFKGIDKDLSNYKNPDNDPRGPWIADNPSAASGNPDRDRFPIENPYTGQIYFPPKGRYWAFSQKRVNEWFESGKIVFPKEDNKNFILKKYLSELKSSSKPIGSIIEGILTSNGTKELKNMFPEDDRLFPYPKPSDLLIKLFEQLPSNDGIFLDFFSGSATTAHAIMKLNSNDLGTRKFILVQIPEEVKNDNFKSICDIGEERIRRAAKNIKEETNADIDYGFRVYKVDSSNMKDVFYKPSEVSQTNLFDMMSNIKEDRTAEDLLIQVMLDLGLTLDLKIDEKNILNNKVYYVADNALIACFDDKVNIDIIDEICKCNPLKVVFKDNSFKTDKDKINLEERIKKLSPDTEISIL